MAKEIKNENNEAVAQAVSGAENFLTENKNVILGIVVAAAVIVAAAFCYHKFVYVPAKTEALEQAYPAEAFFREGDFEKALNGDGNVLGFQQIVEEYGNKAGKASYLYAGVCALQKGDYETAISYLKKYKGKDAILSARAVACTGDAYAGLEKLEDALSCYVKAAAKADNMFAANYLLKAGVVCEELGRADEALKYYKQIKDNYPQSVEGYDIDKYIARIENK